MKLSDYEFLPGIVINNDDPEKIGRINASVPTWFDKNVMDEETMPWIYPFMMFGYQTFSKMENGRKVWVLHNKENYLEYWYVPMFEQIGLTKQKTKNYDNPEVLISRVYGDDDKNVIVYYNDTEGLNFRVGAAIINISKDNKIYITNGQTQVTLSEGNIILGTENSQPLVYGNTLKTMLTKLKSSLENLASLAAAEPYTSHLQQEFTNASSAIGDNINELNSSSVYTS